MNRKLVKPADLISQSLTALLKDAGNLFQIDSEEISRDVAYLQGRLQSEGISFVTKTLPSFGKHFDKCLQTGTFTVFPSFKKDRNGSLPLFLRGLTKLVFGRDGTIRDVEDVDRHAIAFLRQMSFMYYKLEFDFSKGMMDESISNFVNVDRSLAEYDNYSPERAGVIDLAQKFLYDLLKDFDPWDIIPRPGPGQTATKQDMWARYEPHVLYKQINDVYPYHHYYCSGFTHLQDRTHNLLSIEERYSGESCLALVPKDSRGPRIICMEPPEYMWFQQGLARALMKHIESHPLTAGQINFSDQEINGFLALWASLTQEYVTLDMKEASDRVSTHGVDILFDLLPNLKKCLLALSTESIRLPSNEILIKNKYAPMGSALCFPIESLVHYALAYASVRLAEPGVTARFIRKNIFVYGDDLIVKKGWEKPMFEDFPQYGLRFNEDKSCTEGFFRESCGVDAYYGMDVTPLKVKKLTFTKGSRASLKTQLAYFHGLFDRGYWQCAKVIQQTIEYVWGNLPHVSKNSASAGWIVPRKFLINFRLNYLLNKKIKKRWNSALQCVEFKVRVDQTRPFASMIGGWEQLVRAFVHVQEETGSA